MECDCGTDGETGVLSLLVHVSNQFSKTYARSNAIGFLKNMIKDTAVRVTDFDRQQHVL